MDVWHVMNAAYAWLALEAKPVIVSVHGNDFLRPYIPVGCPDFTWLPGFLRFSKIGRRLEARVGRLLTERLVEPRLVDLELREPAGLIRQPDPDPVK